MMSGDNNNVRSDYEGRVRLSGKNLFPDPGLNMFDPKTGIHRYLLLEAPPRPTHWGVYIRDANKVKNSARQVLSPIPLQDSTYDQEDELVHGPSPVDESKALAIAHPIVPDANAYPVSNTIGLPEGYYCIAWGLIPDEDWQKPQAAMTNPGPRSEPFYLAQGQGFMLPTPTEFSSNITALALWITEPRFSTDPVIGAQRARLAPMFVVDRWRVRGLNDFVRVVGPFAKRVSEQAQLPENRNLTFVGDPKNMPRLRVRRDTVHHKHDERIVCQVGYAFQTDAGIGAVKVQGGWESAAPGRRAIVFEPEDFELRKPNAKTNEERKKEREDTGSVNQSNETNAAGEDETTDSRGRPKEKETTRRIRGWRPLVRFKATDDKNDPDDEHGVTEWFMIVDKGGKNAFREKGEQAIILESEPGKWPKHGKTELVRVSIEHADYSGVGEPTEAPEAPEGDMILDLNTSGLTPGKHMVKTSLFVLEDGEEQESLPSPERAVQVTPGAGIRVRRPKFHNLADNDDASELDLEDFNKPLGWDFNKPFPNNVRVYNPRRGGVVIEDSSNSLSTYWALRTPVATLTEDTNRFLIRFNVSIGRHASGRLKAILEEYDMVNGVPQLIAARVFRGWTSPVDDREYIIKLTKNLTDGFNKNRKLRINNNTKQVRVRFEMDGGNGAGARNMDVEVSQYGVFKEWARPRKSRRLEAKRAETPEPKDTVYPHGGYCVIVDEPNNGNPFTPNFGTYHSMYFESQTSYQDYWEEFAGANTAGGRGMDWAIEGNWGYRAAKTLQGSATARFITHTQPVDRTEVTLGTDFFIQTLNNVNAVDMIWLRRADGNNLVRVGVNSNNRLTLAIPRVGGTDTYTSTKVIEPGDLGRLEIHVSGLDSAAGRVRVYLTVGDGRRVTVFDVQGINYTGLTCRGMRIGADDLGGTNTLWDIYYDNVLLTDTPTDNVTYASGNHIEYYGPAFTPKDGIYGPTGVRVPVKGGQTYTVGVNVATEDTALGSSVMRWRARTAEHRIIETYDYVAKGLPEDSDWTRYTQTFTVPVGTAYIEWFENNLGHGTVRIHGIQIEKGAVATEFTDKNALNGDLSVFFQTAPAGITPNDPMQALTVVSAIRDITTVITEDEDTSFAVDFRGGNSLGTLGSYVTTVDGLSKDHKFIEVRIKLSSSSDTDSPELSRIEIDLARPHSHLLREDGTEFPGGVLVNNIAAEHLIHNVERVQFSSGAVGDHTWGNVVLRRIPNMDITAFRPETVAEITNIYGNGFVRLQTPYGRWTIRIDEEPVFDTNPNSRLYLDPQRSEYFQVYKATVAGIIEAEEVF